MLNDFKTEYQKEISYFPTRMLAVQTYYSIEMKQNIQSKSYDLSQIVKKSIEFSIKNFQKYFEEKNLSKTLFKQIVINVIQNKDTINTIIRKKISNDWSITRIPKVTYSILSCSIYENNILKYPFKKLLINDYLQISKALGHGKDTGFINKILDI